MKIERGMTVWEEMGSVLYGGGLTMEQSYSLGAAAWEYHQHGKRPDFQEPLMSAIWGMFVEKIDRDCSVAAWDTIGKQFKAFQDAGGTLNTGMKKADWAVAAWPEAYAIYKKTLHGLRNADNELTAEETIPIVRAYERACANARASRSHTDTVTVTETDTIQTYPTSHPIPYPPLPDGDGGAGGGERAACDIVMDFRKGRRNQSPY